MPLLPLTQSAAQSLLNQYTSVIENAMKVDFSPQAIRNKLEDIEDILIKNAINVYKNFGLEGASSLEDIIAFEQTLNERIEKATENSKSIGMLSGAELESSFIKDLDKADIFNLDLQEQWETFWNNCVNKVVEAANESIQAELPNLAQVIATELFVATGSSLSNKVKGGKNFSIGSKMLSYQQSGTKFSNKTNLGRINETFAACGPKIRQAFLDYLKTHKLSSNNKTIVNSANFQESSTINGASWTLTLNKKDYEVSIENLLKMRDEERQKVFAGLNEGQKRNLVEKINLAYRKKILETCNGANQTYLKQAIDKVIKHSGGNYWDHALSLFQSTGKGLTGVLGEIQAIYFILEISDGKLLDKIDWLGGIKNPHTDILLDGFGAQVKNTSKDINTLDYTAHFQDFGISKDNRQILNFDHINPNNITIYAMEHTSGAKTSFESMGLPTSLASAIETILGMEGFNIEYQRAASNKGTSSKKRKHRSTGKFWTAFPESNPAFEDTRSKIVEMANKCQKIMGYFAANMMYMQIAETSKGESNTFFIAAGASVISAATIIGEMINELENGLDRFSRFQTSFTAKNSKGSFTIVDMINNGGEESLNKINFALQSSYTFIKH